MPVIPGEDGVMVAGLDLKGTVVTAEKADFDPVVLIPVQPYVFAVIRHLLPDMGRVAGANAAAEQPWE